MSTQDGALGADRRVPRATRRVRRLTAEVEEGVMLLEHAAKVKTKNRIIVDVLTGSGLDLGGETVEGWALHLIDQLEHLAVESGTIAERLAVERDRASATEGVARGYHDYRHLDTANLSRRIRVCRAVARTLRERSADPAVTGRLLTEARRMADDELGQAVGTAVASPASPLTPEDAALLADRLHQLATVDLPALARTRGSDDRGLRALLGTRKAMRRRRRDARSAEEDS